jgi:hypothetical protein
VGAEKAIAHVSKGKAGASKPAAVFGSIASIAVSLR